MIELIAAAVSGAVVGGGVVWWRTKYLMAELDQFVAGQDKSMILYLQGLISQRTAAIAKLEALRSNCFIPDERGVKVRYSQASAQRRVKAETPKEVV